MSNSDKPRPRLPFPIHTDNVARYHRRPIGKMTKREAIRVAWKEADEEWQDLIDELNFYFSGEL